VGQDQDQRAVAGIGDALKGHRGRLRKLHCEAAGAQIAPELLPEQHFDIGLIVDDENKDVHASSPDLIRDAPARGRTILNSVNLPGAVSTAIEPECCFTMMS